jgi:hypothetical protein
MFSHEFLSAMVADFREHGRKTIGRVRAQRPEVYLKVCAMLLPREMTITPENLGSMSTEQLEQYLADISELTADIRARQARDVTPSAALIEGTAEPVATDPSAG